MYIFSAKSILLKILINATKPILVERTRNSAIQIFKLFWNEKLKRMVWSAVNHSQSI